MGVSKPTEMTIRDLLQEELRKRGVTVVPEFSVSTPTGVLKPDILLKNGAPYVVETKLGAETKLLEAIVKLYDYSKYVTKAKGAFAILFPQGLRYFEPVLMYELLKLSEKEEDKNQQELMQV